jgi:hypothetical protein
MTVEANRASRPDHEAIVQTESAMTPPVSADPSSGTALAR